MKSTSHILIIDDEEAMRDSCTQILVKEDCRVETAESGEIGLEKVKEFKPDLVLLDLKMPGLSGMDVLKELPKIDPHLITVVITGYATVESAVDAMKQGAYDFLPKPFTPNELRVIVNRGLERRQFILENKRLQKEQEKMRENFVSMISHELKSPLAAVQQNLMVLTGGMAGDVSEKANHILMRVTNRIDNLIHLINDWLDLSRIESGEVVRSMEPIDLKSIISDVIDLLNPLAKKADVDLEFYCPKSYPNILGNKETLHMLFTNLISNGIKYNKKKGRVTVTLNEEDHRSKITVQDTGIGIPEKKLPFIFNQFYRVREGKPAQGSGLGLSIVQKIVEAHSGTIHVESEEGKGTIFVVLLP